MASETERMIGNTPLNTVKSYGVSTNYRFFYTVPSSYRWFYNDYVREWLRWYDGYVDWFHGRSSDHGIFATKLAKNIAHKFAKQTTGGKLLIEEDEGFEEQKEVITDTLDRCGFAPKLTQAFEWAYAAGDAMLKVDVFKPGSPSISVLRRDEYLYDEGYDGEITKFSALLYAHTEDLKDAKLAQEATQEHTYIMEERRYGQIDSQGNLIDASKRDTDEDYPITRLDIKRGTISGLRYGKGDFHGASIQFDDLKKAQRDELKRSFPNTEFGKWDTMPLNNLGVFVIKASNSVSFLPNISGGESIFFGAIHVLMSYDYYYSAKMTDLYLGRARTLLPDHMDSPHDGKTQYYSAMDSLAYTRVPYQSIDDQKPIPIQYDLRSTDWTTIRNDLLQELATVLNLSPRTIASYAVPASEKPTAHEINVDQDDTALTIEHKREINEPMLNQLINTLAEYLELGDGHYKVKFSKMGLTNMSTMVNQMSILKQNGMIDDKTALEYVFPDKTDKQIDAILERMKENKKEAMANIPKPNEDEMKDKDKALYDNQATHTPKPDEKESGED